MQKIPFIFNKLNFDWDYQKYLKEHTSNWRHILEKKFTSAHCYISSEDKSIQIGLKEREWDSNVFQFKVGELIICNNNNQELDVHVMESIIHHARSDGYRLLICRLAYDSFETINLIQSLGFLLVDCMNVYLFNKLHQLPEIANTTGIHIKKVEISNLLEQQKKSISNIARGSFVNSRIHNDKNFSMEQFNDFCSSMAKGLVENNNSTCIIAEKEEKIVGFAIGNEGLSSNDHEPSILGYLWLIAVDESCRGKKVGSHLLNYFLHAMSKKTRFIEIGTQINNYGALSLYSKPFLLPCSSLATFHLWI